MNKKEYFETIRAIVEGKTLIEDWRLDITQKDIIRILDEIDQLQKIIEVKKCPFCGKQPKLVHEWLDAKFYACVTKGCPLASLQRTHEDGGFRQDEWNERANCD